MDIALNPMFHVPSALAASLTLTSWPALLIALLLVGAIAVITFVRRLDIKPLSRTVILLGLLLLALAAGGLTWNRMHPRPVIVMVDLSPSTRAAQYRDAQSLRRRVSQLLGSTPHSIVCFAADNYAKLPDSPRLADLAADRTAFSPPAASAIVLFSDAQFDLPAAAPPVYIAVDPLLQDPPDAAVRRLELRDQSLLTTVSNLSANRRSLMISPSLSPPTTQAPDSGSGSFALAPGTTIFTTRLPESATDAAASLTGSDLWPENDALGLLIPPPLATQRWWVSKSAAPGVWRAIAPARLSDDPADYLAPAVIVLDNVPAGDLSALQQQRLHQYVRDLGGSLLILGGPNAYAAGSYPGSVLESLSPLASSPPTPALHWILLGDSSGSMAAVVNTSSRWDQVKQAMLTLLPHLPPEDPVTIGSFAENLRWWATGKSARETAALSLPPPDVRPNGPTNLEDALLRIISAADAAMPKELLLLTDGDAEIIKPAELRRGLLDKKIRLHLLALRPDGRALAQLEDLVKATAGQSLREFNPEKWTAAIDQLYAMATPDRLISQPTSVQFKSDLSRLPSRSVSRWNRTWLKKSAESLADTRSADGLLSLAARWKVGSGQVLSVAFAPDGPEAEAMANLVAQPPRDPRFKITWNLGPSLHVTIDATDNNSYLNGLTINLEFTPPPSMPPPFHRIEQTGPGRYELSLPSPRRPVFATIHYNGRVLDRTAVAGRYAPEFDNIGNNVEAMRELAERTAGSIIPPAQSSPISFSFPRREVPLTSILAAAGGLFIAAGLLHWRLT